MFRDHTPVVIEEFNGWWQRGSNDSCPLDHFQQADNIQYFYSGFQTRDPIDKYQNVGSPLGNIVRVFMYTMQTQESLLVLVQGGDIYHVKSATVVLGPILSIATMTDFNAVSWAGRAYITPFFTDSVDNYEKGLQNQFLYVYKGDGTAARKAAGDPPTGAITPANGAAGATDFGLHVFGVVFESDTGWLSAPGGFASFTTSANLSVSFTTVPVSLQAHIVKRHIVATKVIIGFDGNLDGYQFFFVPNATINDNVTTVLNNISFYDIDLLDDASHLIDNFSSIPAGVGLTTYHGRLVLTTTYTDISVAYASEAGEPEAINQVDGVMVVPLDGKPLTNCQEYRDVLYLYKQTRTVGYSDNQDVPATWQMFIVDEGTGCSVHGIATVLDSGGVNVDYLLIADINGLMLFDGSYQFPPISYKIESYWFTLNKNDFEFVQVANDSLKKKLWITQPNDRHQLIHMDYNEGLSPDKVKWARWIFDAKISSICLINIDDLIIGALAPA